MEGYKRRESGKEVSRDYVISGRVKILVLERRCTSSQAIENSLGKRLWTCL